MTNLPAAPQWILPEPVSVDRQLLDLFTENPVFAEILHRRGYTTLSGAQAFLYPQYYLPSDPFDFPGMQDALDIVLKTIQTGSPIGICGDFDTDGLTSTAILYEGLLELTPNVHFQVPVRGREPHGISEEAVKALRNLGVHTLITCDTGVSEYTGIQYARDQGMDVIVTDHHTLPEKPVNANVIITPEYLPADHPMRCLSGAGVAYKFIEGLYQLSSCKEKAARFLDLATIGIIGDIVPLTGESRFLTQSGILALQNTRRPGLLEMYKAVEISPAQINEKIISHVIGPRLNSLSRMADGNLAVELLTTQEEARAKSLAQLAEESNTNRKQMMDSVFMAAQNILEQDRSLLEKPLIFLENNDWHYSVLGLVASQLAERYARPVVIISSFDENIARGSARSVPGMDISAVIAENADKLEQFGGHAMAAGFSIKKEKLVDFKRALMTVVSQYADGNVFAGEKVTIDALLPLWDITQPGFNESYQLFRPFGPKNPVINFMAEDLHFLDSVNFGKNMQHRRLNVTTRKLTKHSVIWWNGASLPLPPEQFDMVYQVTSQKSTGQPELQISLAAFRPHETTPILLYSRTPAIEIIDWREKPGSDEEILRLSQQSGTNIFAEGCLQTADNLPAKNRLEITPCDSLILLTCPPGYDIFKELLKRASPAKVYVIGLQAKLDLKADFMQAVTANILESLRCQHGSLNIQTLAAKTGQTEGSIRLAIDWLVHKTTLEYKKRDGMEIVLERSGMPSGDAHDILEDLEKSLEESAAFKRYFRKTDLHSFFLNLETEKQGKVN